MKICVYIGRFQPFHAGHLAVLRAALANHNRVVVLLGSSQSGRDLDKNPYDGFERTLMIAGSLTPEELDRVKISPIIDYPGNNNRWVDQVQTTVERFASSWSNQFYEPVEIVLTGFRKDESSFYLDLLPWRFVSAPEHPTINATDIRAQIRSTACDEIGKQLLGKQLLEQVESWERNEVAWRGKTGSVSTIYDGCARVIRHILKQDWREHLTPATIQVVTAHAYIEAAEKIVGSLEASLPDVYLLRFP
jgi:cytidyltransferase-like protein